MTARNITADLQGDYPWSEENPLLLTNVKVETLGGKSPCSSSECRSMIRRCCAWTTSPPAS